MKLSIKIIILYFLLSIPSFAEIEPMVNVCKETSFLKCTNKSKQECENAINFSGSYCEKLIIGSSVDWNNINESMKEFRECTNNSLVAYFDGDSKKLNKCLSKTSYSQRLEKNVKEMLKK